jgi:hypothetical protein
VKPVVNSNSPSPSATATASSPSPLGNSSPGAPQPQPKGMQPQDSSGGAAGIPVAVPTGGTGQQQCTGCVPGNVYIIKGDEQLGPHVFTGAPGCGSGGPSCWQPVTTSTSAAQSPANRGSVPSGNSTGLINKWQPGASIAHSPDIGLDGLPTNQVASSLGNGGSKIDPSKLSSQNLQTINALKNLAGKAPTSTFSTKPSATASGDAQIDAEANQMMKDANAKLNGISQGYTDLKKQQDQQAQQDAAGVKQKALDSCPPSGCQGVKDPTQQPRNYDDPSVMQMKEDLVKNTNSVSATLPAEQRVKAYIDPKTGGVAGQGPGLINEGKPQWLVRPDPQK